MFPHASLLQSTESLIFWNFHDLDDPEVTVRPHKQISRRTLPQDVIGLYRVQSTRVVRSTAITAEDWMEISSK